MVRKTTQRERNTGRPALSDSDRRTLDGLDRFTLGSSRDHADLCDDDYNSTHRTLQSLQERNLVGGMDAGYSQRRQRRYWSVDHSAGKAADPPEPKHPGLVHALLTRITMLESVYLVIREALMMEPQRRLLDFQWRFDAAADAIARFNDGWMMFVWSGIWQSQRMLVEKLEQLGSNLRAGRHYDRTPLPGRICFVVPDAWQAELVRRVVATSSLADRSLVYDAGSGLIEGDYDLSKSRELPPRAGTSRWSRRPDRLDILMRRLMESKGSRALIRTLSTVEQWPGVPKAPLGIFTGLNGKTIKGSLTHLTDLGLIWQVPHGGYAADHAWLSIAARRDRVWSGRPKQKFGRDKVLDYPAGRIANHEIGLVNLVSRFAAAGCSVAPGWRFRDVMGKAGQLTPDAMIFVEKSLFGPTWFYLEYELSAQGPSRFSTKFRASRSHLRSDDFPVLWVVKPQAIPHVLEACNGSRALVASVNDVRKGDVIGDSGTVWWLNGQPVRRFGK